MAQVGISQDWLDEMSRFVEELRTRSIEEAEDTARYLHERVVEQARQTPGWEALADEIEVWSQDGKLWIGVRNTQYVSEAWVAEYGDETRAPTGFMRSFGGEVISPNATNAVTARWGVVR
jgi:hypothetical protein